MEDFSPVEGTLDNVEFALINLVKGYPELYNSQDPANKDKRRKDLAWVEIARQLSKDEGWCYAKWKNLSDYYKKRRKIYGNGVSTNMRRWVYYDALSFLDMYESNREDANSGVIVINSSNEHSRSSTECNQNYFDETQYQSLEGIADRADVKLRHFLAPISEDSNCPPVKKQRVIPAASSSYSHDEPVVTNRQFVQVMQTNAFTKSHCNENDDDNSIPTPFLTVGANNVTSSKHTAERRIPDSYMRKKMPNTTKETSNQFSNESGTESLRDCPHYHFCMSLASRFRSMDPATATYTQMKIMEVILKAEFPDEYKKRIENV